MSISFFLSLVRAQLAPTARHIVSAHISELGIIFAQKSVDGKSNEISAVHALIGQLEMGGCLVVADALNCQKKTTSAVAGKARLPA